MPSVGSPVVCAVGLVYFLQNRWSKKNIEYISDETCTFPVLMVHTDSVVLLCPIFLHQCSNSCQQLFLFKLTNMNRGV